MLRKGCAGVHEKLVNLNGAGYLQFRRIKENDLPSNFAGTRQAGTAMRKHKQSRIFSQTEIILKQGGFGAGAWLRQICGRVALELLKCSPRVMHGTSNEFF